MIPRVAGAMLVITLLAFAAWSSGGQTRLGAFDELHRARLESTEFELVMGVITRDGESKSSKHIHPHGEFGFVLEGTITVEREDSPATQLAAGSSFYQPPGQWHVVSTPGEGAKTLVFRIIESGQPMVTEIE
jgi:quercetin dioxygenase-like cupin family protein